MAAAGDPCATDGGNKDRSAESLPSTERRVWHCQVESTLRKPAIGGHAADSSSPKPAVFTCHRKQQSFGYKHRRNRPHRDDVLLGSVSSTVPEISLSGELITSIRRAWGDDGAPRHRRARSGSGAITPRAQCRALRPCDLPCSNCKSWYENARVWGIDRMTHKLARFRTRFYTSGLSTRVPARPLANPIARRPNISESHSETPEH